MSSNSLSPEVLNFDWFPSFSSLSGVTGNAPCSCLGSKHLSVGGEHKECYKEIQIYDCHPVYESNSRSLGIPWPNNWSLNFEGFTIAIKLCLCNQSSFHKMAPSTYLIKSYRIKLDDQTHELLKLCTINTNGRKVLLHVDRYVLLSRLSNDP